jgi:hypothetical protein
MKTHSGVSRYVIKIAHNPFKFPHLKSILPTTNNHFPLKPTKENKKQKNPIKFLYIELLSQLLILAHFIGKNCFVKISAPL